MWPFKKKTNEAVERRLRIGDLPKAALLTDADCVQGPLDGQALRMLLDASNIFSQRVEPDVYAWHSVEELVGR